MWRTTAIIGTLFFATTVGAVSVEFTRPLKIGSTGSDVRALQVALNSVVETRVAESGPGSPRQETAYFGNKTALAVSKFQLLHRTAILIPNGLTQGTGYVGPSTLAVLNKVNVVTMVTEVVPPVAKPKLPGNVEGLQGTLSVIERVGIKQGFSSIEIDRLKTIITKDITATTTPLLVAFVRQVQKDNPGQQPITFGDQLHALALSFRDLFLPSVALADGHFGTYGHNGACTESEISSNLYVNKLGTASLYCDYTWGEMPPAEAAALREQGSNQTTTGVGPVAGIAGSAVLGGVPFGGAIVGTPIWCLCTASWWIPITPLPPTMATALSYAPRSQAFLTYNIPETLWMLGFYEPGVQCLIYDGDKCTPLPVEGLITPMVGSSPI